MQYPESPFNSDFNLNILRNSKNESSFDNVDSNKFSEILKWLCTCPNYTTMRVNTIKCSVEEIFKKISDEFSEQFEIKIHKTLSELIVIKHNKPNSIERHKKELMVDADCGAAILRGANIFAPGVLGMLSECAINDEVSVYVDIFKKCKKGYLKIFTESDKVFVGNGVVKMDRKNLFSENSQISGVAVEMKETITGSPQISENNFEKGCVLLQNIPSVVCAHVLNPEPKETVLDMCAAPGNKTTHIAALMLNKGTLVAIDKTPNKVKILQDKCRSFGANAAIFQWDSTKLCLGTDLNQIDEATRLDSPPFLKESFDKILLDAPCSALGKRPQFYNKSSEKVILSFVPLQRKLFENAVKLLKPNGKLVYSTCTITIGENEGMVSWALNAFPNLKLIKAEPYLGGPGLCGPLNEEQRNMVLRFGPNDDVDSVGFFIACFVKQDD